MSNFKNIIGQKFGKLLVVDINHEQDKYGQIHWECVCDCGTQCTVRGTSLRNGHTISCGCIKSGIDEHGNRYGRLVVVGRAAKTHSSIHWECLCSCGNCIVVRADVLRKGKTLSCGCESNKPKNHDRYIDEIGNIYHKLTVISIGERKDDGIYWNCTCECGNEVNIKGYLLRSGLKTSCGCENEPSNEVEIGKQYGRWTVKKLSSRVGNHEERYWDCICDCGTERAVAEPNLKNGYSKSCGCARSPHKGDKTLIDETNKRYGKLTVVNQNTENTDGKTYWNCICDCGKKTVIRADKLRSKCPPDSCGCSKTVNKIGNTYGKLTVESLDKVQRKNRYWWCRCACGKRISKNETSLQLGSELACTRFCFLSDTFSKTSTNQLINNTKNSAKNRKIEYSLKKSEHEQIVFENCFYCGSPPANELKTTRSKKIKLKYSGIDRIDPLKGYVTGNIRPCCIDCNKSKLDKTEEEFFSWLKRIYHNLKAKMIIG